MPIRVLLFMSWPPPPLQSHPKPWRRAGCIAAAAWAPLGIALLLLAQLEATRAALWAAFPTAVLALWFVGRRVGVRGKRDWAKAGCLFTFLAYVAFAAGLWTFVMAGCPGFSSGC